MFKRVLFAAVFVGAVCAAVYLASPLRSMRTLHQALGAKDMATVDQHINYAALSSSIAQVGVLASQQALGGDGAFANAVGGLLKAVVGGAAAVVSADTGLALRAQLERDGLPQQLGPFRLLAGTDALGSVEQHDGTATIELKGTCGPSPASVRLQLQRQENGPLFGQPSTWQVVGIDERSVMALMKVCLSR
jgi:hypothetical protein